MLGKFHQRVISSRHGSASQPASIQAAEGCVPPGAGAAARAEGGVEAWDARPCGFLLTPASAECLIINCVSSSNCCSCRWSWTRHHKQLAAPPLACGRYLLNAPLTSCAGCGAGKGEPFPSLLGAATRPGCAGWARAAALPPARGQPCRGAGVVPSCSRVEEDTRGVGCCASVCHRWPSPGGTRASDRSPGQAKP